ncbi:unnamed protein product [Linum trigynum]|uniref:Uncharacterized protein n=1 Tax=Linum trigynum TaxID=586398 RepID=A0AAV2DR23_9ROSI
MAASSPAPSSTASDSGHTPGSAAAASVQRTIGIQPRTQRGLNKPKCIQCGNVARSRCPFQCCKGCCSRAQNQCEIHVLQKNKNAPDKAPTSTTTPIDQQPPEVSPVASSLRAASYRQLSSSYSQLNSFQTSRSRKPLTNKDALELNKWRFNKLKEFKERNIEKENEAFDRYMQNISLLEETFSMKAMQASSSQDRTAPPDPMVSENLRKRKLHVIDQGLKKLEESEINGDRRPEKVKNWSERASAFNDLIEKLNKARSEDDIKSCLEMKAQLFGGGCAALVDEPVAQTSWIEAGSSKGMDCFSQNVLRPVEIDPEIVSKVNVHFMSLQKIASL